MDVHDAMAFAATRRMGILLTLKRSDGRPQASNVFYGTHDDDHEVRVSVTDDRAKVANLRADPRVSMHVQGEGPFAWVVLEGAALLSPVAREPGDEVCLGLREVYRATAGEHEDWDDFDRAMVRDRRLVLSFRPTYAYGQLPADG